MHSQASAELLSSRYAPVVRVLTLRAIRCEQGIPGCDAARSVMIAMWVFGTVGNDDALINDAHLVAELARVYQNESSGYWVSM